MDVNDLVTRGLALLEQFVDAHERQAAAIERLAAHSKPRPPRPRRPERTDDDPAPSDTDRAAARAAARRLGMHVRK